MDQKDTGESKGAVRAADTAQFGFTRVVLSWRRWWRESVLWTVDQPAVISSRREECELTARYLFMTAMSGGISRPASCAARMTSDRSLPFTYSITMKYSPPAETQRS